MKINSSALVILIPGFPKDEPDTSCLPAQQSFIRTIHELFPGIEIIVLSLQYPFHASIYHWKGIRVVAFGGKNRGGLSRLLLWNRVRRYFKTIRQEYNITGVLSFWCGECGMLGKGLAHAYGFPHFCWLMGQDARPGNNYVRRIRPLPGELVAISDAVRKQFLQNYKVEPEHTIPLGIDKRIYKKETQQRDLDIIGAGSLIPLKQFDVFITVIRELKKTFPGIRAVIYGKGPEENKLRSMIIEQDLTAELRMPGERPHGELMELMKRSRILLHPSSYEGFSGVCLEALGAGAHVISMTRAMDHDIPRWHIASTPLEMAQKALAILTSSVTHESLIPYTMEDTARSVMRLFGR